MLVGCNQTQPDVTSSTATPPSQNESEQITGLVDNTPVPPKASVVFAPAPTPTPKPTLAPVFYTVQSGDSLIAIATRYDISVSTLQEVNGILDPRSLQIGQKLLIPPPEPLDSNIRVYRFPTPLPFTIQNIYFKQSAIGNLLVLGEVYNDGTIDLEQVRVGVTLLDGNQVELAEGYELVSLDLIQPSEKAPFALLIDNAPMFEQYQVYPVSAMQGFTGSYYRSLEVRNLQGSAEEVSTGDFSSYRVNGIVHNIGGGVADQIEVILTAYDALNQIIGIRTLELDVENLSPGTDVIFVDSLTLIGGPVERLEGVAQGRIVK